MGTPNPNPIAEDTIRITVQLEVPHESELLSYGHKCKQVFKDYVNSDKFGSFLLENGPTKKEVKNGK